MTTETERRSVRRSSSIVNKEEKEEPNATLPYIHGRNNGEEEK
jgi:hypothetical protein